MVAAYVEPREEELLDAIVSAAALVARADGWVHDLERSQLLEFMDRDELLSGFSHERTIGHFEHCIRQARQSGGASEAIRRLGRHGDSPTASFILDVGEKIAAADRNLDPSEEQVLQHIREALEGRMP